MDSDKHQATSEKWLWIMVKKLIEAEEVNTEEDMAV